jgi:predicted nucleotide-binding protein
MPNHALTEALKIPRAIIENYAGRAPRMLDVAVALNMSPRGGQFQRLTRSATRYGLIELDRKTSAVVTTELARRLVQSKDEKDALKARREATLRPSIIQQFLRYYDGERFPDDAIAKKMLIDMGISPADATHTLSVLTKNATDAGFFRTTDKGARYVDLKNGAPIALRDNGESQAGMPLEDVEAGNPNSTIASNQPKAAIPLEGLTPAVPESKPQSKKVFITHGKNRGLLPDLKKLIAHGGFEPEIAIEHESVSKSVPDKVIDSMRECIAAVIVIDADRRLYTKDGKEEIILNGNVMIEVGAAMALYKRKFILLVQDGVQVPSNLQGLYQVRFKGEGLDLETGFKLLDILKSGELAKED